MRDQDIGNALVDFGFILRNIEKAQIKDSWKAIIDGFDPEKVASDIKGAIKGPIKTDETNDPLKGQTITVYVNEWRDKQVLLFDKSEMNKLGFTFPNAASLHGHWRPRVTKLRYWESEEDGEKDVQFYTIKLLNASIAGIRAEMVAEKDPE